MKKCQLFLFLLLAIPSVSHAGPDLFHIPVTTLGGKETNLESYRGKTLLIVNTASQCGYTPQYEGLEKIAKKYREGGFVILGFPSNDFGGQEPGSNREIKHFCELKYHVDFPLFAKGPVTGEKIQPVYAWLLRNAPTPEAIEWNFEKFLINRQGAVVGRYKSPVTPEGDELAQAIEKALK